MRTPRRAVRLVALAGVLGLALTTPAGAEPRDIGRDPLAADDGRAAAGGGTTGGSLADDAPVLTVRTRNEPVRALDGGSATPKTNGTAPHQKGTLFSGYPVDLLAIHHAYDSGTERDLTADVGWTPTLHQKIDSAGEADREAARGAGAGRIR